MNENNNSNNNVMKNDVNNRNDSEYMPNSGINVNKYDMNDPNNARNPVNNNINNNNDNKVTNIKGDQQNPVSFEKEYMTNISQRYLGAFDNNEQQPINKLVVHNAEMVQQGNLTGIYNMKNNANNMNPYSTKETDPSLYKSKNLNIENANNNVFYSLHRMNRDNTNIPNSTSAKNVIDNKMSVMQPDFNFNNAINKTENITGSEESSKLPFSVNTTNNTNRDIRNNNTLPFHRQKNSGETVLENYSNSKQVLMNMNNNNNNDGTRTESVPIQDPTYMQSKNDMNQMRKINEQDIVVPSIATNTNQSNILQGNLMMSPPSVIKKVDKKKDNSVKKSTTSTMNTGNPNISNVGFSNPTINNMMQPIDMNNTHNKGFMMGNQIMHEHPYNLMQSQNVGNNEKAKYSPKSMENYSKTMKMPETPKSKMKKYNTQYNDYFGKPLENHPLKDPNVELEETKEEKFNMPYNNLMDNQVPFLNIPPSGNMMEQTNLSMQNQMNYKIPGMTNFYNNDLKVLNERDLDTFKEMEREAEEKKKIKKKERKEEKKKEKKKDVMQSRSKEMMGVAGIVDGNEGMNATLNIHNPVFSNFDEQRVPIPFSNPLDMSNTTFMNQPQLNHQNKTNVPNMVVPMNESFIPPMMEEQNAILSSGGIPVEDKNKLLQLHGGYASQEDISGLKVKHNINLHSSNEIAFPEKNENEEQIKALSKMFGNVMGNEKEHTQRNSLTPLSNEDVEVFKNMSLDGLLDSLNIHKDILNILKDKINSVNRDITVTICSNPLKPTEPVERKEPWEPEELITHFEDFIMWIDNNVIQIKQQLHNVAFCAFLEIYILLITNNYDRANEFKNKYLNRFAAYDPVRKVLADCVTISQIFEISIVRFTHKKAKHIIPLTNIGKEVLFHYLNIFSGMTLYGLITTKMTIEEVDESEQDFNFFHAYITKNFLQNAQVNVPVPWSLPLIYKLKDRITGEDKKISKEKEENSYVPNENTDVYCYYKHILKTQAHNRLKVSKKKLPSMLFYCLNNCNDLTCAEISSFDGSYIATAYMNNTIKLWDLKQSQMNKVYDEEMKFNPSKTKNNSLGELLLEEEKHNTQQNPNRVDLSEFSKQGVTKLYGNNYNVHSLCFGETNKILLSGNSKGEIYLYTTINNRNYAKYVGGNTPIWSIDTAPLGLFFCSGEDDGNVRIYSTNKTYPLVTYKYINPVNICKYHPNNTLVGCGYHDNYLYLYDVRMNSFIRRYKNNYPSNQGITSLSFSKNGRLISFAGGHTNGINVIDLAADKHFKVHSRSSDCNVLKYFDSQSKWMNSVEGDAENDVFDNLKYLDSGTNKGDIQSYEDHILNLDFSYNDKLLVSATCNNIVDFYNCSYASKGEKHIKEVKKTKLEKCKNKIIRNIKLSKSFGVNYSNIISAKFTPENVLLIFGINTLIE